MTDSLPSRSLAIAILAVGVAVLGCRSSEAPPPSDATAPAAPLTAPGSGDEATGDTAVEPRAGDAAAAAGEALPWSADKLESFAVRALVPPMMASDEEVATLRAIAAQHPDDARARRAAGLSTFHSHRRQEALEHLERVVELDPQPAALIELGDAYMLTSHLDRAEAVFRRVPAGEAAAADAASRLGDIAMLRGDVKAAIERYREALAVRPNHLPAMRGLGRALWFDGKFRDAYGGFSDMLEVDPDGPSEVRLQDEALLELARLDLMMGAHERAEQILRVLLEANPDHPLAHYTYARLLLERGRPQEAQSELQAHIRVQAALPGTGPVAEGIVVP